MSDRILNVGCGNDTYGTDFVDLYPMRDGVEECNVNEERLPFNANTFDEVYSRNLLEHMTKPGHVLEEMLRVLKKGGLLRMVTDNASYWKFHFPRSLSAHYDNYNAHGEEDRHYMVFTKRHIENFAEELGLNDVEITLLTQYEPEWEEPVIKYPGRRTKLAIPNRIVGHLPFIGHMAFPRVMLTGRKK